MYRSVINAVFILCVAARGLSYAIGNLPGMVIKPYKRAPLQDIVTWDENSLFVKGERIIWYSGEFHPFRLPVPSLWLDVLQKIKAAGFNGVSFYVSWNLHEGKPGEFIAEGVFDWEPFFEAATKAGIYLLARPGPYINAEISGGGFPGWLQRVNGTLRTRDEDFLRATDNYAQNIGEIIAKAQITNGGPVILFQPENEYTSSTNVPEFPDAVYFGYVEEQFRKAGIVVPYISNDQNPRGLFAPGKPAAVDIYGHDGYPLGFDCANPGNWPNNALPTNWRQLHLQQSPSTPYSIVEFQGGAFDPWGGNTFEKCASLVNFEFERVFYKNNYAFGATIFNIYMVFGGTNWGNVGHPGGYTSYDYGSPITEERLVSREKYSEVKLEANFLQASPAYLTANRGNASTAYTTSAAVTVIPAWTNTTRFYFTRHTQYNTLESTSYKLNVQTALLGNVTIPQVEGSLSLNGRDAKVHVSDYAVGDYNLIYSSAEVFTQQKYSDKTILVVYGGPNEQHELAIETTGEAQVIEGDGANIVAKENYVIIGFTTSSNRRIVQVGDDLFVYLLDRNSAYNYWVLDLPAGSSTADKTSSVVLRAGYLMRTASLDGTSLALVGDVNATTPIEVVGGIPNPITAISFNGDALEFEQSESGVVTASVEYTAPTVNVPDLAALEWKYIDSLPEIKEDYSDESWTAASLATTFNSVTPLKTPTSLYSSDYGYHTGTLIYRGRFTATGGETTLFLSAQGGSAYGHSAWLGSQFLGSFTGYDAARNGNSTLTLPNLTAGTTYVITVVIDNMGIDENFVTGADEAKRPRGILDFDLAGHPKSDVTWKLTGNLGGEDYRDRVRGPLNEGGMFVERQGYHLPGAPTDTWETSEGPTAGIASAGVAFFATSFTLDLPAGYDVPLSFVFTNTTAPTAYRAQLFVNGWQYGKYVNNVGPQTKFPVPEGIFNYQGDNYVGVTLWAQDAAGAKVEDLQLVAGVPVASGFGKVELSPSGDYAEREGAY